MKIKELIEKLQEMPPDGNTEFISGMFIYGNIRYSPTLYTPDKESEAKHGRKTH